MLKEYFESQFNPWLKTYLQDKDFVKMAAIPFVEEDPRFLLEVETRLQISKMKKKSANENLALMLSNPAVFFQSFTA